MSSETVKCVVRLLPPEITEEEFKASVPEAHKENIKWSFFVDGKRYKGDAKPSLNSRSYAQFATMEQAEDFMSSYHGHAFVDGQGENFRAVACIAPYQKVPRKNQKDPREGTIEDDAYYQEFVEALKMKKEYEPPPDLKKTLRPENPGDTPLLQFMKKRAEERKARWDKSKTSKKSSWYGGMETVPEEAAKKRSKYHCSECHSVKNLEEDPDHPWTFYCTECWESWEVAAAAPKKKKTKKKKGYEEEYEEPVEEESSSRKKKTKKNKKEEWEEAPSRTWRAKDSKDDWEGEWDEGGEVKKKKKSKKAKAEEEEEDASQWKPKKKGEAAGDEWSEGGWGGGATTEKKKAGRAKGGYTGDEWWEEKPAASSTKSKSSKWEEDSSWKGGYGQEEKPKRGPRADEGAGARWAPKAKAYR